MKFSILKLVRCAVIFAATPAALASTTWYANGVIGSDTNHCLSPKAACKTIGHAISLASSGDSIMVAPATYTENLTIGKSLNVIGSGASTAIIDGGGHGTVVTITSAVVVLSGLTIRNGSASDGGGIYNSKGKLTISNSTVSGNLATGWCNFRPIWCVSGVGGGISSDGTVTINNSTISGNGAETRIPNIFPTSADGGGIVFSGTLTINNSTVSGNSASGGVLKRPTHGGGIAGGGTLTISNSTISENSAYYGGGISGGATLQNSIVANNLSGGNCSVPMNSKGYNLSSDGTCKFSGPGDMNTTRPLLGTLQNNGGPTQTMALFPGSPAIDAGNPSGCTDGHGNLLKTDQRGMPRPDPKDAGGCDIGAYERQSH